MKLKRSIFSSVLLSSCVLSSFGFLDFFFKDDLKQDVQNYITDVARTIKPSSQIKHAESDYNINYSPYHINSNIQDPFAIKNFVSIDGKLKATDDDKACQNSNCGDGPPLKHKAYFLESFALDQLLMVGSMMGDNNVREALIKVPSGEVVQAKVGQYVGTNNGLILRILPDIVFIQEKVRSAGGWKNRKSQIKLIR